MELGMGGTSLRWAIEREIGKNTMSDLLGRLEIIQDGHITDHGYGVTTQSYTAETLGEAMDLLAAFYMRKVKPLTKKEIEKVNRR